MRLLGSQADRQATVRLDSASIVTVYCMAAVYRLRACGSLAPRSGRKFPQIKGLVRVSPGICTRSAGLSLLAELWPRLKPAGPRPARTEHCHTETEADGGQGRMLTFSWPY